MTVASPDIPICHQIDNKGHSLAAYEWPGEGPTLLLVHATGFHARCWEQVIVKLGGDHVFALDMPSHGRSANRTPPYDWQVFASDIEAVIEQLGLHNVIGVGHSMGAHTLALAAARSPELFAGLILVDPVILSPEVQQRMHGKLSAADNPVSRRRNQWASAEEMFENFKHKLPFSAWDHQVLKDYCNHGLVPAGSGEGFELACPPALEAEVYAASTDPFIYQALPKLTMPVDVIRARLADGSPREHDFANSPTWPELAAHLPDGVDEHLGDRSHFIPMETPQWMAERIQRFQRDRVGVR